MAGASRREQDDDNDGMDVSSIDLAEQGVREGVLVPRRQRAFEPLRQATSRRFVNDGKRLQGWW